MSSSGSCSYTLIKLHGQWHWDIEYWTWYMVSIVRGEMVGNLMARFVGHCCPVGWPALFNWASGGIGSQPILYCCPAKYVYGPVEISTCPVKYFTQRLEISLGNEATSKNCFHRPSEKTHHNWWPNTLRLLPTEIFRRPTKILPLPPSFLADVLVQHCHDFWTLPFNFSGTRKSPQWERGIRAEIWQFNFLVAILDFRGHFEFGPYDMKNDNILVFLDFKNPY